MFGQFWQLFVVQYGRLPIALFIIGLGVIVSMLEGINMGLLVPLLETLESSEEGQGHWITQGIADVFAWAGLPFELVTIILALGALILVSTSIKYARLLLANRLRETFTVWLRAKYMSALLRADISYFHSERLGVMTATLTNQCQSAGAALFVVIELIANMAIIITFLAVAFVVSAPLTGAAFALMLIVTLVVQYFVAVARRKTVIAVTRDRALQVSAIESLTGIHLVKSFLLEPMRSIAFKDRAGDIGDIQYQLAKNGSMMMLLQEISLFALIGAIVLMGVMVFDLGLAVIVALLFILYRLSPRITQLNALRITFASTLVAVQAVTEAMEEPANPKVVSGDRPFSGLKNGIELKEVHFSYDVTAPVLRGTCLNIGKGKMTAIVGASGAGKTTLMDLLLRFYDPVEGSILVDGVDLKELDLASWRKSIGVVTQDVFLFNDTIANNISLNREGVTRNRIVDATKRADAHEFIQALPNGYDTEIGDRGWNLSGGQRQRVALARAIVENPEILILDEATSSLDSETERSIQDYMSRTKGTSTLVVVAHRLSTIKDADKIVVIRDGKVVEEGDYATLIEEAGIFANYHQLQATG